MRRDFPWLDPDSRQARDVERFRWFSDGYVAVDPRVPNRIVDMRYSMVPNTIDPLWGIELDPEAPPDGHVRYLEVQEARSEQRDLYRRLLTGENCRALTSMRAGAKVLSYMTRRAFNRRGILGVGASHDPQPRALPSLQRQTERATAAEKTLQSRHRDCPIRPSG